MSSPRSRSRGAHPQSILPSDSIDYATKRARQLIQRGRAAIADLPDTDARQVLDVMAEFVITRPM
jgi:geranylgeranyl pyrophosphate synthase